MTFREQLISKFSDWLENETALKPNTRRRYASHINCMLRRTQEIAHLDQLAAIDIPEFLKSLPHGYRVKQHTNALEYFQKFTGGRLRFSKSFAAIANDKPDKPPTEWEPFNYDKVFRTINAIRNRRLKMAYRLMLATGMRVSEIASITKGDITLSPEVINIHLADTKNNEAVDIHCEVPYIVANLPQLLDGLQDIDKVFHSGKRLREVAESYGFMCHDLRRAFASDYCQASLESGSSPREAKKQTAAEMRHSLIATTNTYLSRDINRKGKKSKGAHKK